MYDRTIIEAKFKEMAKDIQGIIETSKATFFVNNGEDIEIPMGEALYELKAEISNRVGMYFYELLKKS
mgnify:CR=1 FL=1